MRPARSRQPLTPKPVSTAKAASLPPAATRPSSGLAPASLLQRAERLGHHWPPRAGAGPGSAAAPLVQRATLSVDTPGTNDYAQIVADAKRFHRQQGQGVFYDVEEDEVEGATANETHLDAVGHGNAAQIGSYSPPEFAQLVSEKRDKLGLAAVSSVTLHSCEAASALDVSELEDDVADKYRAFNGQSFVERLHREFLDNYFSHIEVSGFAGETFTDREGQTRLLKTGLSESDYRRDDQNARRLDAERGGHTEQDRVAAQYFQEVDAEKKTVGAASAASFGLVAWGATPESLLQSFDLELESRQYMTPDDVRTVMNAILRDRFEDRAEPGEVEDDPGHLLREEVVGKGSKARTVKKLLSGEEVQDRTRRDDEDEPVEKIAGAHDFSVL
jgi:hypothetical protein